MSLFVSRCPFGILTYWIFYVVSILLFAAPVAAQNFVYTNNNVSGANTVSAFAVAPTGSVTKIADYPTGGGGTGGSLFPANRAATTVTGNFLYVGNDGNTTLSAFRIDPATGGLTAIGGPIPVGSGVSAGISAQATPDGKILYVSSFSNPGGDSSVAIFAIDAGSGALTLLGTAPAGGKVSNLTVSADGRFLAAALFSPPSRAAIFLINPLNGALTPATGSPFTLDPDSVVGSLALDCAGTHLFAAIDVGGGNPARVRVYDITQTGVNTGALTEIAGSPFDIAGTTNGSTLTLGSNDKFLYVGNQGGGGNTITALAVAADGSLSPVAGSPFPVGVATVGGVTTSRNGRFLYSVTYDSISYVVVKRVVLATGILEPVPGGPVPTGQGGSAQSIAAYPAKNCAVTPFGIATPGQFRPSNGFVYLRNSNSTGIADNEFFYGQAGDIPVTGDWDGNGTDTVGIYRDGTFFLRNSNTAGFADVQFPFGAPGDIPVVGDWDGDGIDTVGIVRGNTIFLRNSNTAGDADIQFNYGTATDICLAGDWNGDGIDTVGCFRPSSGFVFLRNSNTTGVADIEFFYGQSGDKPVAGDWNGDGIDTIGIVRGNEWFLRNANSSGFADLQFFYGTDTDAPITGNWN
jgi:6-phosphogluconolactonase (cycloisomerase 2 family)